MRVTAICNLKGGVGKSTTAINLAAVLAKGGEVFLTADHGNAEKMCDDDGGPYTAHTNNPVPYIMIGGRDYKKAEGRALCDIAPTLLHLMGMEQPSEMTGTPIVTAE